MASYQADIQIGVKGKAQLNQLEKQLNRVNTAVKQLNKALVLKTRAQTIKLNTKGAMSAIRELEKRINRLGRTVDIRVRTTEEKRESRKSAGATSGAAPLILSSQKSQAKVIDSQKTALAQYRSMTEAQRTINRLQQEQAPLLDQQAAKQKEIADQVEKIRKNRTEAENVAKGFGTKARLNQLNFGYEAQVKKLKRLRGEYVSVTEAARDLGRTEAAVRDQIGVAAEKRRQRVNDLRRRRARGQNIRRGLAVGGGAALTQIPGLGGVATGALAGAAVGGPLGALAGGASAAIAELTTAMISFTAESGKFTNALVLQRKALANTVETTEEYEAALQGIRGVSQDFLVPIGDATQQFTKLNAAARASGFTVDEVTEVYRGLAAANVALGGNSERLQGILLATQQVFSKGKVQAEELRGQIGERLAGAFAKFAESAGLSTSELDKALEKGEVSLEDFVRFSKSLLDEYEEDAKRLAKEPENSAARLEIAMDNLKEALGEDARAIIQMFNDAATAIVNFAADAIRALNEVSRKGFENRVNTAIQIRERREADLKRAQNTPLFFGNDKQRQSNIAIATRRLKEATENANAAQKALNELNKPITPTGKSAPPKPITRTEEEDGERKKAGSRGGGSSAKSVRESELPALQRQLALLSEIDKIEQKIIAANKVKDTDLVIRLQGEQRLAEIAKSRLDILAEEIPPEEKKTKLAINQLEAKKAIRDTDEELRQAAQARQDSINDAITAFQNEVELAGVRNEAARELLKIEQDIRALRQTDPNFTEAQIQAYRLAAQGAAAAREEQRQYNQILNQAQGPVSALTSGLREVVSGTKTAEEAFADFLNTIADQLIQTASVMIAQYIAIGIARAFAGIPAAKTPSIPGAPNGTQVFGGLGLINTGMAVGATGGYVNTSKSGGVDGKGGRAMIVHPDEFIVPAGGQMPGVGGETFVNITVNTTSGGANTSSQGEKAKEASALGRMVETAVVGIINREKRPGGLLTR